MRQYGESMPGGPSRIVNVEPPALGRLDGLAYALFEPPDRPLGGVVILHGAGSSKESHFDFARLCRASGLAAVCFDQRGHGDSDGALDDRVVDDVAAIRTLLPRDRPAGLRGSSMGGWLALVAAERVRAAAVVAICPATSEGLLRGLRQRRFAFDAERPALDRVLAAQDPEAAAAGLGDRLLLLHAEGDETVPVEVSKRLHELAPASRLVVTPGGHHRSIQHDGELQALAVRFLATAFRNASM
jgi:pimeloyl-ACP methyl ester carboxylesterase